MKPMVKSGVVHACLTYIQNSVCVCGGGHGQGLKGCFTVIAFQQWFRIH